jgi:predicted dehydrogenase
VLFRSDHQRYLRYGDADQGAIDQALAYERATVAESIGSPARGLTDLFSGVLQGSVCHEFSLLRAVFGEARLRVAHAQVGKGGLDIVPPAPPQIQALGSIGDAQLAISWNWLPDYPEYTEELAIFGSAGRAYLNLPGPYIRDSRARLRVETADGVDRVGTEYRSNHETAFVHELRAFVASVDDGAPVRSTARGAVWDVAGLQRLTGALAGWLGTSVGGEAAALDKEDGR